MLSLIMQDQWQTKKPLRKYEPLGSVHLVLLLLRDCATSGGIIAHSVISSEAIRNNDPGSLSALFGYDMWDSFCLGHPLYYSPWKCVGYLLAGMINIFIIPLHDYDAIGFGLG